MTGAESRRARFFLDPDHYVYVPLESNHAAAWKGLPAVWREVLEPR